MSAKELLGILTLDLEGTAAGDQEIVWTASYAAAAIDVKQLFQTVGSNLRAEEIVEKLVAGWRQSHTGPKYHVEQDPRNLNRIQFSSEPKLYCGLRITGARFQILPGVWAKRIP